jgi:hypothetical protein
VIAFKVPNMEVDKTGTKFFTHWEPDKKTYTLQVRSRRTVVSRAACLTVITHRSAHCIQPHPARMLIPVHPPRREQRDEGERLPSDVREWSTGLVWRQVYFKVPRPGMPGPGPTPMRMGGGDPSMAPRPLPPSSMAGGPPPGMGMPPPPSTGPPPPGK